MKRPLTNLRVLRLCHGFTLQEVAALLGISCQSLCNMETLRRKPGYAVLCKLESLFGKSHNELFSETNSEPISSETTIPDILSYGMKKEGIANG